MHVTEDRPIPAERAERLTVLRPLYIIQAGPTVVLEPFDKQQQVGALDASFFSSDPVVACSDDGGRPSLRRLALLALAVQTT